MENSNKVSVTIKIDEDLKKDLQNLLNKLGMDMTTFFNMTAKQAVREQAVPFIPSLVNGNVGTIYNEKENNIMTDEEKIRLMSNIGGIDGCIALVKIMQEDHVTDELLNRLNNNLVDISRDLKDFGNINMGDAIFMM